MKQDKKTEYENAFRASAQIIDFLGTISFPPGLNANQAIEVAKQYDQALVLVRQVAQFLKNEMDSLEDVAEND